MSALRLCVTKSGEDLRIGFVGSMTPANLATVCDRVQADPAFDRCRSALWDFTGVSSYDADLNYAAVERVARHITESVGEAGGAFRIAICSESDVGFGIGRMFSVAMESQSAVPVEVFRDLSEAEQWLRADLCPASVR
jgi:hypothetical protein